MSAATARDASLDAVRGVALFGIIIVNGPYFAGPAALTPAEGDIDLVAQALVAIGFAGKFFPVYSFLFGYGLAVLIRRAEAAGDLRPLRRRLIGLGVIGAVHAALLFFGDILLLYALLGPAVLIASRGSNRAVFAAAIVILVTGIVAQVWISAATQELWAETLRQPVVPGRGYLGGFLAVTAARLADLPLSLGFTLIFNGPVALAAMLFGLIAARTGALDGTRAAEIPVGALFASGVALGTVGAVLIGTAADDADMRDVLGFAAAFIGAPPMVVAIVLTVRRIAISRPESAPVRALARIGRTALTGYLLHSLLFGAIVYGWGLGLYGSLGAGAVLAISVAVYGAVAAAIVVLTAGGRTGPAEAVLRAFARGGRGA